MRDELILVLDAGTTSTRAMLFALDGQVRALAQQELTQFYPAPGLVEHDPAEIWERTLACARDVAAQAGRAGRIAEAEANLEVARRLGAGPARPGE